MTKSPIIQSWPVLLLLIATASLCTAPAAAEEGEEENLYRVEFQVQEFKNGTTASERNYSVLARANSEVSIRTGNRVPIATPDDGLEYLNVGLHIDCRLRERGERILLSVATEINSFVLPEHAEGDFDNPPVIRAISSQVDSAVALGERTMVSSVDDVMSDSRYQLDAKVTKVD